MTPMDLSAFQPFDGVDMGVISSLCLWHGKASYSLVLFMSHSLSMFEADTLELCHLQVLLPESSTSEKNNLRIISMCPFFFSKSPFNALLLSPTSSHVLDGDDVVRVSNGQLLGDGVGCLSIVTFTPCLL